MIEWYGQVKPSEIAAVACSGGIDSMVMLEFLRHAGHKPEILFFHHGTENSDKAYKFILKYNFENNMTLHSGYLTSKNKPKDKSYEEWWRDERYNFLEHCGRKLGMIGMAHNLNDAVETWIFNLLHAGKGFTIPYSRLNVIRPLLTTSRAAIETWAKEHHVSHCEDESNTDLKYVRNRIRHVILPEILKVNPGIFTIVKKHLKNKLQECELRV
jgi:tRNA(Ile)-lysidine synthase